MLEKIKSLKKIVLSMVMSSMLVFGGEIPNEKVTENPDREVTTVESMKVRDKAKLSLEITKVSAEKVTGILNNGTLKIEFPKANSASKQNRMYIKPDEMSLSVESSPKESATLVQKAGYTAEEIKSMIKTKENSKKTFKVENLEDKYVVNVENVDENEKIYLLVTSGKDLVKSYEVETVLDTGPIDLGTVTVYVDEVVKKTVKLDVNSNLRWQFGTYNIGTTEETFEAYNGHTTEMKKKKSTLIRTEGTFNTSKDEKIIIQAIKSIEINNGEKKENTTETGYIYMGTGNFTDSYEVKNSDTKAIGFLLGKGIEEGIELYIPLLHESVGTDDYKPFEDKYEFTIEANNGKQYKGIIKVKFETKQNFLKPNLEKMTLYARGLKGGYEGYWDFNNLSGFANDGTFNNSNRAYLVTEGANSLNMPDLITRLYIYNKIKGKFGSTLWDIGGELNQEISLADQIYISGVDLININYSENNNKFIIGRKDMGSTYSDMEMTGIQYFYIDSFPLFSIEFEVKYSLGNESIGNIEFNYDNRLKEAFKNYWIAGNGDIYSNFNSVILGNYQNFVSIKDDIKTEEEIRDKKMSNINLNNYITSSEETTIKDIKYTKYTNSGKLAAVPSSETVFESFIEVPYINMEGESLLEYTFLVENVSRSTGAGYTFELYKNDSQYQKTNTIATMEIDGANGAGQKGTWETNESGDTTEEPANGNNLILKVTNGSPKLFELGSFGGKNVMSYFEATGQKIEVISQNIQGTELYKNIDLNKDSTSDIKITLGGDTPNLTIETLDGIKSVEEGDYQVDIKAYYSPTGSQSSNDILLGEMTLTLNVKNDQPSFSLEGDTFIDFGRMIYDPDYIYHGASNEFKVKKPDETAISFIVNNSATMTWQSGTNETKTTATEEDTTINIQDLKISNIKNNGQEATFRLEGRAVVDKPKKAGMYKGTIDVTVTVDDTSTSTTNKR